MAQFTTFYSGSSGNCAWVEENGRYLLVDMGKSCRITLAALQSLGCDMQKLGGILVTHEHSDHIKGLEVFLRRYNVPVYGTAATLDYLAEHGMVPGTAQLIDVGGGTQDVAGFSVTAFPTSHDSVDCCGYHIATEKGKTISLATDLGYISEEVQANLHGADVVSLEANYDHFMLMSGPYPSYLKARIDSRRGHLCNSDSAAMVTKLIQNGCKHIALCHISNENNTPGLVLQAVQAALLAQQVQPTPDVTVQAAARHDISPVFTF